MVTSEKRPPRRPPVGTLRVAGAFFAWFMALFGLGAGLLASLLALVGELSWPSPILVSLLCLFAAGIACLIFAVKMAIRTNRRSPR